MSDQKSFIKKLYAYSFFEGFLLLYPVYSLLFKDSGISTFGISILLAIWMGTTLLLEIPTGILADKYSRKKLLLISKIIKAIGLLSWILWHTFPSFAFGFVLWGLSGAMESGTYDAYIYDGLKNFKIQELYEKINGRIKALNISGTALALVFGGFLAEQFGYDLVLILSMFCILLTVLIAAFFKEVDIEKSTQEKKCMFFLRNTLRVSFNDKRLLALLLVTALVLGNYGAFDEFIALISDNLGMGKQLIGILLSAIYLAYAFGSFLAGYIPKERKFLNSLILIFSGVLMLSIAIIFNAYSMFLLIPVAISAVIFEVKILASIQSRIESNKRATILSIKEFLLESIAIIFTLIIGLMSGTNDYRRVVILCSVLLFLAVVINGMPLKIVKKSGQGLHNRT